jgi:pilus assembly protein Flp/PilA
MKGLPALLKQWRVLQRTLTMKTFLKTFLSDQSGAAAAEYALILAIIGVALGAAALALGYQIKGSINQASNEIGKGCPNNNCAGINPPSAPST